MMSEHTLEYRYKVSFVATGSEITNGSILNTNTPYMAAILDSISYKVENHITCGDSLSEITSVLDFLKLQRNDIIIIVGGLGPTQDDITIKAVSKFVRQPLVFNEDSWQRIKGRYKKSQQEIPQTNKKQAYFPKESLIIPNNNGTADGCISIYEKNSIIITLPGPPNECIPMFKQSIKQYIIENYHVKKRFNYQWLLIGIAESKLAELINQIATDNDQNFAYRAEYPYIELKLDSESNSESLKRLVGLVDSRVKDYCVGNLLEKGSLQLQKILNNSKIKIRLLRDSTHGYITSMYYPFKHCDNFKLEILLEVSGAEKIWCDKGIHIIDHFNVNLKFIKQNHHIYSYNYTTNFRVNQDVNKNLLYVYEWVSVKILDIINKENLNE